MQGLAGFRNGNDYVLALLNWRSVRNHNLKIWKIKLNVTVRATDSVLQMVNRYVLVKTIIVDVTPKNRVTIYPDLFGAVLIYTC